MFHQSQELKIKEYQLVKRFAEPSSWAGLAAAMGVATTQLPGWWPVVSGAVCGVCAAIAFFMKDPTSST